MSPQRRQLYDAYDVVKIADGDDGEFELKHQSPPSGAWTIGTIYVKDCTGPKDSCVAANLP